MKFFGRLAGTAAGQTGLFVVSLLLNLGRLFVG